MRDNAAALAMLSWSELEARERICRLLASGWRINQLAEMFGLNPSEIERLIGREEVSSCS
jgi:AraC-like DNA-binding protein